MKKMKVDVSDLVKRIYEEHFRPRVEAPFIPGQSKIPYAGRVFDQQEILNAVEASLEFWLTSGPWTEKFESGLGGYLGVPFCYLVNSGSSANLLAFMALTSDLLENRKIERGDEVITLACGFPTTVAPIVQYGAVPVFVDVTLPTYNIDCDRLEEALSPRTKAVMLAHTLGNPFDIDRVKGFCEKHGLWLIEDNCDALGSTYASRAFPGLSRHGLTGTFGDIGTSSFYPPHHMTMGEGGAVYTNNPLLAKILLSMRDWGRDCVCRSGQDNRCGHRFQHRFGELPFGYDHKYVYSHFGYNLKATEIQAAIGYAQLEKLPAFGKVRRDNWSFLRDRLSPCAGVCTLPEPTPHSDPSWFGFPITVSPDSPVSRDQVVQTLEEQGIQTRMLFAGNLVKHPCFDRMRREQRGFRIIGDLKSTDLVMNNTFWVGVYPGMKEPQLEFIARTIRERLENSGSGNQ